MFRQNKKRLLYPFSFVVVAVFCLLQILNQYSNSNPSETLVGHDEYNCGCPRNGKKVAKEDDASLCSVWSASRGQEQNVVAYTIYGDHKNEQIKKHYYDQIEDRLNEIKQFYGGWIVRLYHNASSKDEFTNSMICKLYCKFPYFDPCQVKNIYPPNSWLYKNFTHPQPIVRDEIQREEEEEEDEEEDLSIDNYRISILKYLLKVADSIPASKENNLYEYAADELQNTNDISSKSLNKKLRRKSFDKLLTPKMWRFLPMADPLVSNFLVRDVDSFILPREFAAVRQWLDNSTAVIHSMRDHPSHNGAILAGLWGGSRKRDEALMTYLFREMLKWPPKDVWDYDQQLLRKVVWPEILDNVLVHDSYHCRNPILKAKRKAQPFPTKRNGRFFVSWGPQRSQSELKGIMPCPKECRPKAHQDWTRC